MAASIAGLISITVEAVKFLSPYVSASKRTPHIAAHVYSEVQSTQVILIGLQNLTKNLGSIKAQHAALIGVNQVIAILTDGVFLYSELQNELRSLPEQEDIDERLTLRGRLLWARKESTFVTLLQRLQSFKSSTSLILMILQRYEMPAMCPVCHWLTTYLVTQISQQSSIKSSSATTSKHSWRVIML